MLDLIIEKMHDVRFMTMLLSAIAATATVYALVTPLLVSDTLSKRMKAVASGNRIMESVSWVRRLR